MSSHAHAMFSFIVIGLCADHEIRFLYDGLSLCNRIVGALSFRDCIRDLFFSAVLFVIIMVSFFFFFVSLQSFFSTITQAGQLILASPVIFALAV